MRGRLLLPVLPVLLLGCVQTGTKAGQEESLVVLHVGTVEDQHASYAASVRDFASAVERMSDGSIDVVIDFETVPFAEDSEQLLLQAVRSGEIDVAFVPTRVFDTADIDVFTALQSPMLIDSPELAGAVAADAIGTDMLDGLAAHDLVGLGLVYEGLRRPLAIEGSVTRPTDFDRRLTRVPVSGISDEVFRALGADPDNGSSHVASSSGLPYVLAETEFGFADEFPRGSTVTANIVLFPKYQAIVTSDEVFERLTDDQQRALRDAGQEAAVGAARTTEDDQALAATFCENGGHVVLAPDAEVAAIRDRVERVATRLRDDPTAGPFVIRIEELRASMTTPTFTLAAACLPPTGDGARLPEPAEAPPL